VYFCKNVQIGLENEIKDFVEIKPVSVASYCKKNKGAVF